MTRTDMASFEFGRFRIDNREQQLYENGVAVALPQKAIQTLLALVENHGRLVEKADLLNRVWSDVFVEEAVLTQNVFLIRKALRDNEDGERYIETVPKRGYRFVADVRRIAHGERRSVDAPSAPTTPQRPMLVVLPIANLTGDAEQDYLIDGFTESLIAELGMLNPDELGVIARTSAMTYKGTSKTIRTIADELNVQYALEGSVRLRGDTLLTSVQLIRASDQCQVFSRQYEQARAAALRLQDDVSMAIAAEVRFRLSTRTSVTASATGGIDPTAYDHYLRGRYYWGIRTPDAIRKAVQHFNDALRIDANYALAHSGLAVCLTFVGMYSGQPPRLTLPHAKQAAQRAIELNEHISEAHSILGITLALFDYQWNAAERELRRAIELDPNSSVAHHWYAFFLALMGRHVDGLLECEIALRLDPHSPAIRMNQGILHQMSGRRFLTIDIYQQLLREHPHNHICRIMLATNLCKLGEGAEGIAHFKTAYEHSGQQAEVLAHLALGYALLGQQDKARETLAAIKSSGGHASPYYLARAHACLGDADTALQYLDAAYENRDVLMMYAPVDEWLASLHSEPRFAQFVARMQYPA